ncbi:MAG: co-chaperone GroES [Bifidobacteriaceae bacterium]|nr:co-chaperone GroES [Bifidobacteriaceae bacterium]
MTFERKGQGFALGSGGLLKPLDDAAQSPPAPGSPLPAAAQKLPDEPLPVRLLADRLLVMLDAESAERRSAGGILIPATAAVGKRLAWAHVVALGANVRQVAMGDRILFDPEDRAEVEIGGQTYLLLRERNVHGVAQNGAAAEGAGMYL